MPVKRFVGIPPNQSATGDIESMDLLAGQSVGLVREIKPAGEIVRDIMRGAQDLIARKLMGLCAGG
jgi:NAD(P)H-dependent flavin oxidoreductase YrpB (nitropropane dioxygenase family)